MKLPLKYIALLVILSLTGVFAYQTYWLTNLYRTQRSQMGRNIREAMRMSDYNEMIVRVRRLQNDSSVQTEVTVSTGYDNERAFTKTHTIRSVRAGRQHPHLHLGTRRLRCHPYPTSRPASQYGFHPFRKEELDRRACLQLPARAARRHGPIERA